MALHYTVLAERRDTLRAALALFPVVGGVLFTFLWVSALHLTPDT